MALTSSTAVFNGTVGILPTRQQAGQLGAYYTVTNPTPGTGITGGLVTGFSATADGLMTIANSGGRTIYLDVLTLMISGTMPTGTTVQKLAVYLETGIVAPTAGNSVVTAKSLNPGVGVASSATVNVFVGGMATIPATAAGATRTLVTNTSLPTSLGIVGDSYVYNFGGDPAQSGGQLTAARLTAPARIVTSCNPVTIPPNYTAILDWWWITQAANAPVMEYELGWFEL
jgi:hypothetical protein